VRESLRRVLELCDAVCCNFVAVMMQYIALCCSVLQLCCNVLRCVAVSSEEESR